MANEPKYLIFTPGETLLQSIIKDVFSILALSFMVYISRDSTWWTFLTGSIALFLLYGVMVKKYGPKNEGWTRLRSKAELVAWAQSQPEDETN